MNVLQVIHGYPMRFNAGSEVYTQALSHGLARRHQVRVFTRREDPFSPDYDIITEPDPDDPRVTLHLVNLPNSRDRYRHEGVDQRFSELLDEFRPHVVHVGHLNHLSTSLIEQASARDVPVVFTLHDYWLMCPRGQFLQMHPANPRDVWSACDGQEDRKCAERCYARYFSGASQEREEDVTYWTGWVGRRMEHMRRIAGLVDLFIAPSRYLLERFRDGFCLPAAKLRYLDYGFDLSRLMGRRRQAEPEFVFGYIGTHIPAKGIHHLVEAFGQLRGRARLRICPGTWSGTRARYLECGVLAHGLARVRCESCKDEFLVAFSCKGRGVCPSCNAKRAHVTAVHLVEQVLPHVPYRQWTLSFPHRVRWVLLKDGSDLPETRASDPHDCGSSDEVTPRTDKGSRRRSGPDDLARRDRHPAPSADRLHWRAEAASASSG